jgi:ubiquinone/menaquinone biosynthesis C-methylase UbiE
MDQAKSDIDFQLMSLTYLFRDLFQPRMNVLREVGIEPGSRVLDYGCGPGSYIIPLAELVGASGRIYALDIHPLAVEKVQRIASRRQLTNVETICSDCATGLPDGSVDVVLLYDTLHALSDPDGVLRELRRVLTPDGILSLSDHHMEEDQIISKVANGGWLRLSAKGGRTYNFLKGWQKVASNDSGERR